jgi:hypothetical protein
MATPIKQECRGSQRASAFLRVLFFFENIVGGLRLALLLGGGLSKSSKLKVLAVAEAAVGWLLWPCGLVRLRSEGLRIPRRPNSERGHPG